MITGVSILPSSQFTRSEKTPIENEFQCSHRSLLVHEIAPRLCSMIPRQVIPIAPEDLEDLRQDAIALAAKLLTRAIETGKAVTPGNIAHYTVQLMRSGRRSTGATATDALAPMTGMRSRARVTSTEQPVSNDGGEPISYKLLDGVH
jgi:hypothetical protein